AGGSAPSDTPMLKGRSALAAGYALGVRNPGGLAFHPATGTCFVVDAGDQTQDEIDEVSAGANFGWPTVLGPVGSSRGFADPAWSAGAPAVAVAGAVFLSGPRWRAWV